MQGKHHLTLIAALTAAAFATAAGAAETAEKTGEVVVTASRVAQELEDVPMSVSVITSDDIRRSSARTVGELLEDIPGVQIMNDGTQGLKRLSIRGEDAFRTLVMIDGQKISEHKSMSGAPILIDPTEIERIEVIKGPASVLYGSDAIGGAVNIITKKGGDRLQRRWPRFKRRRDDFGLHARFPLSAEWQLREPWRYPHSLRKAGKHEFPREVGRSLSRLRHH